MSTNLRKNLDHEEKQLAEEIKKGFPLDQWLDIKFLSERQRNYQYYKKAIDDSKIYYSSHE